MRQVVDYIQEMTGQPPIKNDEQLLRWLDSLLTTNATTPNIESKYFSAYQPKAGFRFSVERVHGITQRLPHIVVTSIAPPGSIYLTLPKKTPDVTLFTDFNLDNQWSSLQYNHDFINYTGLQMSAKLGFIIDVKAAKPLTGATVELIDVGWTFLPIYSSLENEDGSTSVFCNSGLHSVILFVYTDIDAFIPWPGAKRHCSVYQLITGKHHKSVENEFKQ